MKIIFKHFWGSLFTTALLLGSTYIVAKPIVIGSISATPSEEINTFLPLANYLSKKLSNLNIDDASVIVTRTAKEMAELMKKGEIDLFIDSSMSALLVKRLCNCEFLARRWKQGISEYHSVIFVKKDSPIQDISQLKQKSIAFLAPQSTSGYLLPASYLRQAGIELVPTGKKMTENSTSFQYTNGNKNTILWVLHGKTDAGAMSDDTYSELTELLNSEFKIIYHTPQVPFHIVINRPGMRKELKEAIFKHLVNMNDSEEGKTLLYQFEKTTKFDAISDEAIKEFDQAILD